MLRPNLNLNSAYMVNYDNDFNDFEECLKKHCNAVVKKLNEPLKHENIAQKLQAIGINSNELILLYSWKNGIEQGANEYIGKFDFSSHGKMLSLEDAIIHYNLSVKSGSWEKKYFPIFTTFGGDYLLFDTDIESSTYGMLFVHSPSLLIIEPKTAYDNLESFLKTSISCFEKGVYRYDANANTLEIDFDGEFLLSYQLNPKSQYWRM